MSNIIVTGGTGFLGRNMTRRLCAEDNMVYAILRPESKNRALLPHHANIIPVCCELSEIRSAAELQGKEFDAFYHFAWGGVNRNEINDESVHQRSLEASLAALEAAVDLKCGCFLFSGSRNEYGRLHEKFREDSVCRPIIEYGRAKLEFGNLARKRCAGTDTQYIHARIFSVYGPDDHPWSLIYTAVTKMLKNEPMALSACTQLWNFMDVRDMADLLLTFQKMRHQIPAGDNGIFNVATAQIRPLRAYVEEIYRLTGSHSELRFGAFHQSAESAMSILPDMTKVETVFGWKQKISFQEGIRNMIEQMEDVNA